MHSDFSFLSAELYELLYGYGFLLEEETLQWREMPVQFLSLNTNIDLRRCFQVTHQDTMHCNNSNIMYKFAFESVICQKGAICLSLNMFNFKFLLPWL